jgi:hypothetical protein
VLKTPSLVCPACRCPHGLAMSSQGAIFIRFFIILQTFPDPQHSIFAFSGELRCQLAWRRSDVPQLESSVRKARSPGHRSPGARHVRQAIYDDCVSHAASVHDPTRRTAADGDENDRPRTDGAYDPSRYRRVLRNRVQPRTGSEVPVGANSAGTTSSRDQKSV